MFHLFLFINLYLLVIVYVKAHVCFEEGRLKHVRQAVTDALQHYSSEPLFPSTEGNIVGHLDAIPSLHPSIHMDTSDWEVLKTDLSDVLYSLPLKDRKRRRKEEGENMET